MRVYLGLTLFEMLTVLAVIAILTVFSFPLLQSFLTNTRDHLLQAQLIHAVEIAIQAAHHRGLPVILSAVNERGVWILYVDEKDDGIVSDKTQIIAKIQMNLGRGHLYWRSYPRYRSYLLFLPRGWRRSDNSSFWFCHAKASLPVWALMLNQAGRTHVVYPDQQGIIKDGHGLPLRCD